MARQKKPTYEWVEKLNRYRKRIKDVDGKYVAIYGKTVPELEEKLAEAERIIKQTLEEDLKLRLEGNENIPTVREYAEKWLSLQTIRPTTLQDYSSCVKLYIIKPLGEMLLSDITADDAKTALALAANKSASVYRKVQMLLKRIFAAAVKSNIIKESPCDDLNPKGGNPAKEKQALTDEQVRQLIEAVSSLPVYPFVMVGLYAGLRREEILGLKWKHVHLEGDSPFIEVRFAWHIEHNRPIISDQLKTKKAKRDVPIPPQLVKCLKAAKKNTKSEYVIANSNGDPLSGTQWQRLWKLVITRTTKERKYFRYENGVRTEHIVKPVLGEAAAHNQTVIYSLNFVPTPHQLRHTYITNLLLSGVDVKTVQYLAGHEHAKITMDIYAHLTYNRPEHLIEKVNKAFSTIAY